MSSQTSKESPTPTPPATKPLTSESSSASRGSRKSLNDLIPESFSQLEAKVSHALAQQLPYIECDPEVLDEILHSPDWRKAGYIHYKGVKVYWAGRVEEFQAEENKPVDKRLFPS